MNIPYFQVNSFTSDTCQGNPAGVCILNHWLEDKALLHIAAENDLSETAFLVPKDQGFEIRWFTPDVEVDLCGHATLASAWAVLNMLRAGDTEVIFQSKSGELTVTKQDDQLTLDFPSDMPEVCVNNDAVTQALGAEPAQLWMGNEKVMAIFFNQKAVTDLTPDFDAMKSIKCQGIIATAPADDPELDFVSRFFAPSVGIDEDPVTGAAHCVLIPYWATRLEKDLLKCQQISKRGGQLTCEFKGPRTHITGQATVYLSGVIHL